MSHDNRLGAEVHIWNVQNRSRASSAAIVVGPAFTLPLGRVQCMPTDLGPINE